MGRWLKSGQKKHRFGLDEEGYLFEIEDDEIGALYTTTRTFYKNFNLPSLRKSITTAVNMTTKQFNKLIFVHYVFKGGEQPVPLKPHGNSRCKSAKERPYKRKLKRTIELSKEKVEHKSPRKAIHNGIQARGGIRNTYWD